MTEEQLKSDVFFKKLKERIIPIEKAKHPERYLKYDYSGIDKKIHQFIENLTDSSSIFDLFGFSSLSEDDVIRLAILFVCRPDHLIDIYKEIKNVCNSAYDFKGLIYSESDYIKSEDIYADYKSLVFNTECFEDCKCISDHEKYRIWRARSIMLDLYSITQEFDIFDDNKRLNAINWIGYFNKIFFNDIMVYKDEEQDQYGICKELSIELYMDFIETIVRLSLMYYVPAYVRFCSKKSSEVTLENAYKIVLERTERIKENIEIILHQIVIINDDGSKSVSRIIRKENDTISFDNQIKRFVYFLERNSKYNVAIATMDDLKKEKDDNSKNIDLYGFKYKLVKKYTSKKHTLKKSSGRNYPEKTFTLEEVKKYRETFGMRKVFYSSQRNVANDLLQNAKKEHNNGLLYCSQMTTVYREMYVRRNASIIFNESATKIIHDLASVNFQRISYYNLLLRFSDSPSPFDKFKAKKIYRRQLDFLDQKFIRGYFFDNEMKDEYDYYIMITRNIYLILLNVYLFLDYDIIFSALRNIADWFVDVLIFDPDQKEPEPIIITEKINKDGTKRVDAYKVTTIERKNKAASNEKRSRGRTKKIPSDVDKKIEDLITSNNKITAKKIINMLSLDVTEQCVRNHLAELGYRYDRKNGYTKKSAD